MIDDLIFFGIDHNIPEEKGLNFLFRMFMAYMRNIERYLSPLKNVLKKDTPNKFTPKPLPDHLRKRRPKNE